MLDQVRNGTAGSLASSEANAHASRFGSVGCATAGTLVPAVTGVDSMGRVETQSAAKQ